MSTEAPAMVERKARILGFGAYPGRNWSITPEQWHAANGDLASVPVNFHPETLGHTGEAYRGVRNVLEGRLGEAVGFSDDGAAISCDLRLHPLLDQVAREEGLAPSVIIDRKTGRLLKIDLVKAPHYKGAVVMSEEEDPGLVVLFADDEPLALADPAEADGPDHPGQMMHALAACHHPGLCSADPAHALDRRGRPPHPFVRLMHDYTVAELGAHCPGMEGGSHERVAMSDDIQDIDDAEETPRERALRERLERAEASLIEKDALAFADEVCRGDNAKAYPAERPHIVKRYAVAARDDARHGDTIAFADEQGKDAEGSRVQAIRAEFAARPRVAVKQAGNVALSELDSEPAPEATGEARDLEALEAKARGFAAARNGRK